MLSVLLLAALPALSNTAVAAAPDAQARVSAGALMAANYPPEALKAGHEGRVGFRLNIEPDGWLESCEVTDSSGFESLDYGTCAFLIRYTEANPVRTTDGRAVRAAKTGYIDWRLPPGMRRAAAPTARSADEPVRIVCKRDLRPGSMVVKATQCMTPKDWSLAEKAYQDEFERMQTQARVVPE